MNIPSVPWNGFTVVGSSGALEFNETPKLAIIGAGNWIRAGSVWSRLGSVVDIYEAENTLPMLDDDVSRLAQRIRSKINIQLGTYVKGSKKSRKGISLDLEIDGKTTSAQYDKVIVAGAVKALTENLLVKKHKYHLMKKDLFQSMNIAELR